jgi:hypothetical protein
VAVLLGTVMDEPPPPAKGKISKSKFSKGVMKLMKLAIDGVPGLVRPPPRISERAQPAPPSPPRASCPRSAARHQRRVASPRLPPPLSPPPLS